MIDYVFIACVKTKRSSRCKAKDMYISPLFKKAYQYALKFVPDDKIYILSAKYGLIHSSYMIDPYEKTLNAERDKERRIWAYNVIQQMKNSNIPLNASIMLLGGVNYTKYLSMVLKNASCPLKGLGMGKTLQWYNKHL